MPAPIVKRTETLLTRPVLEQAMMDWTRQNEGIIGFEYIGMLIGSNSILEALDKVSNSMKIKQASFDDNNACLIWTAYMNMQEYGTPGFSLEGNWDLYEKAGGGY